MTRPGSDRIHRAPPSALFLVRTSFIPSFQELFGISPMRYLKVRRLNAVRQRLKASDPENCTITFLASEFGFYSPSHFTRDYKTMFGELPSETLRKKK
ncbi:helix-turn-helix domain-containing protein [Okeania sp. SIO2B9]|uniref:helix-turn-helix domain-containing protein n=1 Tax=Okeania sp. SIO2B9 TaxID=2607782 RepID=UPI00257D6088|nr:helix-turn-helix domain-containing protein [Okeania sp. SIO2B9]